MLVSIGNQVFYLFMVFFNIVMGEELQVWVYYVGIDVIYIVQQFYVFVYQGVSGSFDVFYEIEVFIDGDVFIGFQVLLVQQILQGVFFVLLGLQFFLEWQDNDGIVWLVDFNLYVLIFFNGVELMLILMDFVWFGFIIVIVCVIEQIVNVYFVMVVFSVIIEEGYVGLQWEDILIQSVELQAGFELLSLFGFEVAYGGFCLDYSLMFVLVVVGSQLQLFVSWSIFFL